MKRILAVFGILCTIVVDIRCQFLKKEMDDAFEDCLKVFDVTVDKFESTDVDLTCFNTCVAIKADLIKDKKFNLEKVTEYLTDIEEPEYAKYIIKTYEYCLDRMLDIEDECESYVQLEECVNKKLEANYKED